MPIDRKELQVDGCSYTIELGDGVLWIYDAQGERVADAERDEAVEQVFANYFDDDGLMEGHAPDVPRELYDANDWERLATWLISTHPSFQ